MYIEIFSTHYKCLETEFKKILCWLAHMYENNSILPTTYIHHEKQVLSLRDECQYIQQDSEKQAKDQKTQCQRGAWPLTVKPELKRKNQEGMDFI